MKRDGFIFYRSFKEALRQCPDDVRLKLYDDITDLGLDFIKPEGLEGLASIIFPLIEAQIEANNKRYINGKKGATHGGKGGRPKQKKQDEKHQENPIGDIEENPIGDIEENPIGDIEENPNKTPKEKDKEKEKVKDKVKDKVKETDKEKDSEKEIGAVAPTPKKTLEERERIFREEADKYRQTYGDRIIDEFLTYWTEPTPGRKRMRFEGEKTWEMARRISTWFKNDKKFYHGSKSNDHDAAREQREQEIATLMQKYMGGIS